MRHLYRHALLAATFLASASLVSTQTVFGQDANQNGGFESSQVGADAHSGIDSWSFADGGGLATFVVVDAPAFESARSLEVTISGAGSNPWDIQAANENIVVEPFTTYNYSVRARSDLSGATANFTVGNYSFSEYGRVDNGSVSLTSEWQEFSFQFTTDGETTIRAPIHLSFSSNFRKRGGGPNAQITPGVVHIDALRIYKDETPTVPPPTTIPLAEGHAKFLGNIYSPSQIENFEYYWTQLTPENAGKWGTVEATRDVMDWTDMDAAYAFAQSHDLSIRYHVLVWGQQQPSWIDGLSQAEQLAEIEEWFAAVAARYPDLEYVEVVNEPLNAPPSYAAALGGSGGSGWDWVVNAFALARQYFPASKLMINEYGIISARKGTLKKYRDLITLLNNQGLIDGIGVQGHAFSTNWQAASVMVGNLNDLATTGLPIQITEMDVDGPTDQEQLDEYQRIFPPFWEHPAVEGITLWGWKPGMWRTAEGAYIVHSSGEERPATPWLRGYLSGQGAAKNLATSELEQPATLMLHGAYPNPFNPSTSISFSVPQEAHVRAQFFDALGRAVGVMEEAHASPGTHSLHFDGSGLSSGLYFFRISATYVGGESATASGRMTLIK